MENRLKNIYAEIQDKRNQCEALQMELELLNNEAQSLEYFINDPFLKVFDTLFPLQIVLINLEY